MKRIFIGAVLGLAIGGYAQLSWLPETPSPRAINKLKASGNHIVAQIEQFRGTHGRYPATLIEAGVSTKPTKYGAWEYSSSSLTNFELRIGDYGASSKYFFVLWWNAEEQEWGLDT
jgi:hypothetical protein